MSVAICGSKTTIAHEFIRLLPRGEDFDGYRLHMLPQYMERYLICAGLLVGTSLAGMRREDCAATWDVNFVQIAAALDQLFSINPKARVCVIGSESGYRGSYDMAYAGAKAALHLYVETKRLPHPGQQLVAIAPSIIADSGMTRRRSDVDRMIERAQASPKKRLLSAVEVARLAYFLLYVDDGYLTGTVIRMHGGAQCG